MTSQNTALIRIACTALDGARQDLHSAMEVRKMLNPGSSQNTVEMIVGSVRVPVMKVTSASGWASNVIRGREMILLGMQKVASAHIEACQEKVTACEKELQNLLAPTE